MMPVERDPDRDPDGPKDLEPQGNAARRHASILSNSSSPPAPNLPWRRSARPLNCPNTQEENESKGELARILSPALPFSPTLPNICTGLACRNRWIRGRDPCKCSGELGRR